MCEIKRKKQHKYLKILEKMSFDKISQQKSGKLWNCELTPRH